MYHPAQFRSSATLSAVDSSSTMDDAFDASDSAPVPEDSGLEFTQIMDFGACVEPGQEQRLVAIDERLPWYVKAIVADSVDSLKAAFGQPSAFPFPPLGGVFRLLGNPNTHAHPRAGMRTSETLASEETAHDAALAAIRRDRQALEYKLAREQRRMMFAVEVVQATRVAALREHRLAVLEHRRENDALAKAKEQARMDREKERHKLQQQRKRDRQKALARGEDVSDSEEEHPEEDTGAEDEGEEEQAEEPEEVEEVDVEALVAERDAEDDIDGDEELENGAAGGDSDLGDDVAEDDGANPLDLVLELAGETPVDLGPIFALCGIGLAMVVLRHGSGELILAPAATGEEDGEEVDRESEEDGSGGDEDDESGSCAPPDPVLSVDLALLALMNGALDCVALLLGRGAPTKGIEGYVEAHFVSGTQQPLESLYDVCQRMVGQYQLYCSLDVSFLFRALLSPLDSYEKPYATSPHFTCSTFMQDVVEQMTKLLDIGIKPGATLSADAGGTLFVVRGLAWLLQQLGPSCDFVAASIGGQDSEEPEEHGQDDHVLEPPDVGPEEDDDDEDAEARVQDGEDQDQDPASLLAQGRQSTEGGAQLEKDLKRFRDEGEDQALIQLKAFMDEVEGHQNDLHQEVAGLDKQLAQLQDIRDGLLHRRILPLRNFRPMPIPGFILDLLTVLAARSSGPTVPAAHDATDSDGKHASADGMPSQATAPLAWALPSSVQPGSDSSDPLVVVTPQPSCAAGRCRIRWSDLAGLLLLEAGEVAALLPLLDTMLAAPRPAGEPLGLTHLLVFSPKSLQHTEVMEILLGPKADIFSPMGGVPVPDYASLVWPSTPEHRQKQVVQASWQTLLRREADLVSAGLASSTLLQQVKAEAAKFNQVIDLVSAPDQVDTAVQKLSALDSKGVPITDPVVMFHATSARNTRMVEHLLDIGAAPIVQCSSTSKPVDLLRYAITSCDLPLVQLLVQRGAPLDDPWDGGASTPRIALAEAFEPGEVVELLHTYKEAQAVRCASQGFGHGIKYHSLSGPPTLVDIHAQA
eukprot:gene4509-816_t